MTEVEQVELAIDTELRRCRTDPLRYVRWAWPWGEVGGPLEHDTGPEPWQADALVDLGHAVRARAFNGYTSVMPIQMAIASGHGVGKSALGAWIVHWAMDTRAECKARVTANTMTQLETSTWAAIQSWGATKLTADRWTINSAAMYVPGDRPNWFCMPVSCKEENSQAFAGLHNRHSTTLYLFDEGSTIAEGVYQVAMGGLTDGEPMIFIFGNPSRRSGQLYRAVFGSERDLWMTRIVNGDDCLHSNKELYRQWRATYGEDSDFVRVRILGQPPNADELQFIDHTRVVGAQQRHHVSALPDDPLIAGVDVSGGGSSATVCRFRQGFDAYSIKPLRISGERSRDRNLIISTLAEALQQHPIAAMFVDAAFGAAIVERLHVLGFKHVHEVNFGSTNVPDVHQAHMRAYMWNKMKDWLCHGAIDPKDQRLADDLEGPGYHLNHADKLVLESKESMQKRGVASPDDGDALALTFAQAVRPDGLQRRAQWAPVAETWAG